MFLQARDIVSLVPKLSLALSVHDNSTPPYSPTLFITRIDKVRYTVNVVKS